MSKEPIVIINSIVAVIVAVIAALVTGGALQIDPDQQKQLVSIVAAVGTLIATFVGRSKVTPVKE